MAQALSSGTRADRVREKLARARETARRRPTVVAAAVITVLAIFAYAQPVFDAGFYYDDYLLQAAFQDADSRWFGDLYAACRDVEPAGRPGGCVYHSSVYTVLGDHIKGYHLLSIVYLIGSTLLLYLLMVRCRVPRWAALLVAALYVLYPGSDATRLWPTAVGAQFILGCWIAGVVLAIDALRSSTRKRRWLLHGASLLLYVAMLFTYEIVVPLIALSGLLYALATSVKIAWKRAAFDLALAGAFALYRLAVAPAKENSGFVVERTLSETIDRAFRLLKAAWLSFYDLFFPTVLSKGLGAAAIVLILVMAVRSAELRRSLVPWLVLLGLSVLFAAAGVLSYITSNDYYVPDTGSTFNRLNLAPAMAYCAGFGALIAMTYLALRRLTSARLAAEVLGVAVVLTAASLVGVSRDSQAAWAESWRAQGQALRGIQIAVKSAEVPQNAAIMTFGHPIWERNFVPVFSAGWDVRGAIDIYTHVDPPAAMPFVPGAACGPNGVTESGQRYLDYRGGHDVWFVNANTAEAYRVRSQRRCEELVAGWGRPPFMGATVTANNR